MKKVTAEQIAGIVQAQMDREAIGIKYYDAIETILKEKFEGKKLTARLKTLFDQKFPGLTTYFGPEYGMIHFNMWGGDVGPYDKAFRFLVAYDAQKNEYRVEYFHHNSACYGRAAKERNEERAAFLADKYKAQIIADAINAANETREKAKGLIEDLTDKYALDKFLV